MVLDFRHWERAVKTVDEISLLHSEEEATKKVDSVLADLIKNGSSQKEIKGFLEHLNSLFLNIVLNRITPEGIGLSNEDRAKYFEIVRAARIHIKDLILNP
jgi:hypothetical protein